jgi:hypothetical protein
MEIPKKASIRDILDSRTLSLIANQLDKEDQKSFLDALKLPRLKTNLKELKESKTKNKLNLTHEKIMTKSIIDLMTKRMIDGIAPPRELFTTYDWSQLRKGKSLNQSIFMFLNEYLKHFLIREELKPLIQSIHWSSIKGESGHKTLDFLIQTGIVESLNENMPTTLVIPDKSNDLIFGVEQILVNLALDLVTLFEPGLIQIENLKLLMRDDPDLNRLYKTRTKKYNKMLKNFVKDILKANLESEYKFESDAFQLYLSILGGVFERAIAYDHLSDLYMNLDEVLVSTNILSKMEEEKYLEEESLYDAMKKVEAENEMVSIAKSNIRNAIIGLYQ